MDMCLVLAIDLLDMPWSRSSIMSFALIFLAMWFLLPWIGCMASRFYGRRRGDTEMAERAIRKERNVWMGSDTESAKQVLLRASNTHRPRRASVPLAYAPAPHRSAAYTIETPYR
ncbi:hypothetical protein DW180_05055 [Collinsella sp. AM16-21]|nr:hypothetical protein DW180_05055 [Collinsella sp. AM16-21]